MGEGVRTNEEPASKGPEPGTVGWRIRQRREALELSQAALGDLIGVRGQSVWRLEMNESDPSAVNLIRLARALKVSPAWIMTGEEIDVEDPPYPAFAEFLALPIAADLTNEERAWLASYRGSVEPDLQTYLYLFSARRHPGRGRPEDASPEEIARVNDEARASAAKRGLRPLNRDRKKKR